MKELKVKRFREVVVERLEGSDVVEVGTGKVFREEEERRGIERELKVVRVGPNPKMVSCQFEELASRRTCVVNVRDNRKWVRGMKFVMEEPVGELEYQKPWVYAGKAPRRRGRW